MVDSFARGYAFILEGDTEKAFYLSFLNYLAQKNNATLQRTVDTEVPDVGYLLYHNDVVDLIKMHVVNSISQMPRTANWVHTHCTGRYGRGKDWSVFLCYDTDDYQEDVTPFLEGDWDILRKKIRRVNRVIDVAARADIEDAMLTDLAGICGFLGVEEVSKDQLTGRKGKARMKALFRAHGAYYHSGDRARPMIDTLDMQKIIDESQLPLQEIERIIFG